MAESEIGSLSKERMRDIKLIVFDVDGVLVPRGTKIKQVGNKTVFETKKIAKKQIDQIKRLHNRGFLINISSGRGLYMLQEMFRDILPFVSLTYENGSATFMKGKIYQHINSLNFLGRTYIKLARIHDKRIKGFEPKEFIITLHCKSRVKKVEKIISLDSSLYGIWNGEAYDVGIKNVQTKALGIRKLMKILSLRKKNVLVIGDNYNDKELLDGAGIAVSADKSRVEGDFYIPLSRKKLPADVLMTHILSI